MVLSVAGYGQDKDSVCCVFGNCFSWNLASKYSVSFQNKLIFAVEMQ